MRASQESDEELMKRYVQGDMGAFEALYERHSARVYSFLLKRARSRELADDLHQAAFLKFHQSRERYTPKFAVLQWLYVIAKTTFLDHIRKTGRQVTTVEGVDTSQVAATSHAESIDSSLLDRLSADQKQVVEWRFLDEESYEQIAARLGKSTASIRQNVSRALKRLRSKA